MAIILFYLLPAVICWFLVRWYVKNGYDTEPDLTYVFLTIMPFCNIIMIAGIMTEVLSDIWTRNSKGKNFSRKFFRL